MSERIALYRNPSLTDVKYVYCADFSAVNWTKKYTERTVDDVVYKFTDASASATGILPFIDDETAIYKLPLSEELTDDTLTFFIKPDMRIVLHVSRFKNPNNVVRVEATTQLYVGEQNLPQATDSQEMPNTSISYFIAKLVNKRSGDISGLIVYRRVGDTTIRGSWAADNFWDGSRNVKVVSSSPAKKSTSRGGQGAYNWDSDSWKPVKQWANANTLNTHAHGLHAYIINNQMLDYLHETLWNGNIIDKWRNYKFNPIGGIIALHCLPRPVPTNGAANQVTICGQGFYMGGLAPDLTQSCQFIEWTSESIRLDSSEYSESYLDYSPYMNALLKLPFVGWQAVDINTIMDGSFYLHYTIDIINGNCIVEMWVTDRDGHEFCYGGWSGNCAYSMPITANDGGGMAPIKSAVAATISLAVPALSAAAVLGGMASSLSEKDTTDYSTSSMGEGSPKQGLMSAIDAFSAKHNMSIAGQMPANIATMTDDLDIHLILTGQNNVTSVSDDTDSDTIMGSPASWVGKMSEFTGELIQGVVHAHDIPHATEEEKNEIESLIKGGVYL